MEVWHLLLHRVLSIAPKKQAFKRIVSRGGTSVDTLVDR